MCELFMLRGSLGLNLRVVTKITNSDQATSILLVGFTFASWGREREECLWLGGEVLI